MRCWVWARDNLCEEELEHILIELSAEIFDFYSTSDNESLFLAEKQMTQSLVFQVQNWYEHVGGDGFHCLDVQVKEQFYFFGVFVY